MRNLDNLKLCTIWISLLRSLSLGQNWVNLHCKHNLPPPAACVVLPRDGKQDQQVNCHCSAACHRIIRCRVSAYVWESCQLFLFVFWLYFVTFVHFESFILSSFYHMSISLKENASNISISALKNLIETYCYVFGYKLFCV